MDFECIDFHTHPFLIEEDNLCAHKDVMQLTADSILFEMNRAGVSQFCGSIIKRALQMCFQLLRDCNLDALRLRDYYNGAFIPGFQICPSFLDESVNEIDFAYENGVRLIGELVPYCHGWSDYSCAEFSALLEHAAMYDMLVSLHTMDMAQMEVMVREHPRINFVFAHPGEKDTVLRHIDIMKRYENVYLDISGTGILRYGMIKRLVNECGSERILFGTDYPIGCPDVYIACILSEKITDNDRERIFSKNAKRLLQL